MNESTNKNAFVKFVNKHHPFIFTVTILLVLAGAVFSLYQIVDQILTKPIEPNSTVTTFDQEVIDKIKKLHASGDETSEFKFPSTRSNPFVE